MTVAELIAYLQTQPQDIQVAYLIYSEQRLLETEEIEVVECGVAREDGWVHNKRSDKPSQLYLMFPGN